MAKSSIEKLNASRLNKVVEFLHNEVTITPAGFKEETEVVIAVARALVEDVSFKEVYKVDKLDLLNVKTFTTRYNKELMNLEFKVKYNGFEYRIKHIEDIEEARRYLKFTCEKVTK